MKRSELTSEQRHAVNTIDANYPLIAGAGTGKTTTLSFRYVELLEQNPDLNPRQILVTTFTKRAARELVGSVRERVLHRIRSAEKNSGDRPEGVEVDVERWKSVLDDLDEAYIHTLHAFCQRVLQEYAFDAPGIERGFDVVGDVEADRLQDDAIDEVLEERSNSVSTILDSNIVSEEGLKEVLKDLFGKRPRSSDWSRYWSHPERDVDEYVDLVENTFHPLPDETAQEILSRDTLRNSVEDLRSFLEDPPVSDRGKSIGRIEDTVERLDEAGGLEGPQTPTERRQLIADLSDILTKGGGDKYSSYSPKKGGWEDTDERREDIGRAVEKLVDSIDAVRWLDEIGGISLENDRHSAPLVFAFARLFDTANEMYDSKKRDRNLVDYTDLVEIVKNLLTEDTRNSQVRQRLRNQFRYVMVDEVQDTDPAQWEIIGELTSLVDNEDRQEGGVDTTPDGSYGRENVFIVGDEKQSIYRFRGADVEVFERSRAELVSANSKTIDVLVDDDEGPTFRTDQRPGFELAQNFRTLPNTLEFINSVFDGILSSPDEVGSESTPEKDTENPLYEAPSQSLYPMRENPQDIDSLVEYLFVPDEDLAPEVLDSDHHLLNRPMYHRRSAEARCVASRITRLLDNETLVYPEEDEDNNKKDSADTDVDEKPRPVEPNDIAVILRKRTHLSAFKREFEDLDIPYSVVQGEGFFETTEIRALMNLLKAVEDPTDEVALYGVLRSPMFGIEDDTLAPYADEGDLWESLCASEENSITKATGIIRELRQMSGIIEGELPEIEGWKELLDHAVERTGFMTSMGGDERPRQAVANIDRFRHMLDSNDDISSITALIERLEQEAERGERSPEATVPEGDTGVQVLTVHAAKGSEFPVVIVPGICSQFNTNSPIGNGFEFETVDEKPALGIRSPDPENPFERVDTVARNGIRDERLRRLRAEEKRTLYVACTRARDHLILAGTHKGEVTEDGELELNEPDRESPSSWRDMLQPTILNEEVLSGIATDGTAETEVNETLVRDGTKVVPEYTVRIPGSPADISAPQSNEIPVLENKIEQYVPREPRYMTSPSSYSNLMSEKSGGKIVYDSDRNLLRYSSEDDEKDRDTMQADETISDEGSGPQEQKSDMPVPRNVFGEAVHRICELNPDRSEWNDVIRDTLKSEGADLTVAENEDLCEKVYSHADRALGFVSSKKDSDTVRYDELELTAELENGSLHGFIDCLLVHEGGEKYHVIDYKTGDYTQDEIESKTEHYQRQLDAYAAMLSATADPGEVETTLYYTSCGVERSKRYVGDELKEIESKVDTDIMDMS
jgi:ATP-dependent helicase/nuclease subunit A